MKLVPVLALATSLVVSAGEPPQNSIPVIVASDVRVRIGRVWLEEELP